MGKYQDLKNIVAEACSGSEFLLDINKIAAIADIRNLSDYFPKNKISLSEIKKIEENHEKGEIVIHGKGRQIPFKDMSVDILFNLKDEAPVIELNTVGADNWKLDKSFVELENTSIADIAFSPSSPPKLNLSLNNNEDSPEYVISINGAIVQNSLIPGLPAITGQTDCNLSGFIMLNDNACLIEYLDLTARVSNTIDLTVAQLTDFSLKIKSRLIYSPSDDDFSIMPYLRFEARIRFEARGRIYFIPVSAELYHNNNTIRFSAGLTDGIDAGLHEISALTGQIGLGELIPKDFHLEDIVKMSEFFFDLDLKNPKLITMIGIGIKTASPWTILHLGDTGNDLVIRNINIGFRLNDPFENINSWLSVSGEIVIGKNCIITISASYPELFLRGNLEKNTQIRLDEIISFFIGSGVKIPDMHVDNLFIEISGKEYTLDVGIMSHWQISPLPIAITGLKFKVSHQPNDTNVYIEGDCVIAGAEICVAASYPGKDEGWMFQGKSDVGKEISLKAFVSELLSSIDPSISLPNGIPDLYFKDVDTRFNTKTGEFAFQGIAGAKTGIPIMNKECGLKLGLEVKYCPDKTEKKLTGEFNGSLSLGATDFNAGFNFGGPALTLAMDKKSKLNFKEVAEFFLGETLFNELPQDLAKNLAGIEVVDFESRVDFENKGFYLSSRTTCKDITLGTDDLLIARADITLKLDVADKKKYCMINIEGAGSIGHAISFEKCRFHFEYEMKDDKTEWELKGSFGIKIIEQSVQVKAGFKKEKDNTKRLSLDFENSFPAVEFGGVAFAFEKFTLDVKKEEHTNAYWDLSGAFTFKTDLFTLEKGMVSLINTAEKTGLKLSAQDIEIRIIKDAGFPWFTIEKPSLELTYQKTEKQWACAGGSKFIGHETPKLLHKVFPTKSVEAKFKINKEVAEFEIVTEDCLYEIPMPPEIPGLATNLKEIFDFGSLYVGIKRMKLYLINGGSLSAELQIGLPAKLNDMFSSSSKDINAEDKLEIFRVFDPCKPDKEKNLIGLDIKFGAKEGFQIEFTEKSPFVFFEIVKNEKTGKKTIDMDLKEFGRICIEVPSFSLKADGSLKASGGFAIKENKYGKKELQLPLTPVKHFLKLCNLNDVANCLENGIPLKGIEFYSQKDGESRKTFHSSAFLNLFSQNPPKLPDWLDETFRTIDKVADRLPDALLEYGNIVMPEYVHFDIDLTVDGGINFTFSVKDPDSKDAKGIPIKLLIPTQSGLMGVELYSASLGEMFGGTLLRLDLDIKIDFFDIVSLVTSLAIPDYEKLPEEIKYYLADPKKLHQSFRIHNLMTLIVYESGVPIPIPVFYDELSLSSKSFNGFEVVSSFSFKKPEFNLTDVGTLISELTYFFKDGKDLNKIGQIAFCNFVIGQNFIRFPKYISTEESDANTGKLLGIKKPITIAPMKFIAGFLNGIKNHSINNIIQILELENRIGDVELTLFKVLNLHFQYAVTTPGEFASVAYRRLGLPAESLALLPSCGLAIEGVESSGKSITNTTEGLIIFMKGNLNIANFIKFDTAFGLAAIGLDFGIGLQFKGKIGDYFAIDMAGIFSIQKQGEFLVKGGSKIVLLGQEIVKGSYYYDNRGISIESKTGTGPIQVKGKLEGKFTTDLFKLEGISGLVFFGLKANGYANILISDTEKIICFKGDFTLGDFLKLELALASYVDTTRAGMLFTIHGKLSELLELSLSAKLSFDGREFLMDGDGFIKVLNKNIITGRFKYVDERLAFDGHLDLFPANHDLLKITGNVSGDFLNNSFALQGNTEISVVSCKFGETILSIDNTRMMFTGSLFGLSARLFVRTDNDRFLIYGTMSKINIGDVITIEGARNSYNILDSLLLGGPFIIISKQPPYLVLDGKIKILGIEALTQIVFDEYGFEFTLKGKIHNLIEGESIVIGKTFDIHRGSAAGLYMAGKIEIGEITGTVCSTILSFAKGINDQFETAQKDLETARRLINKASEDISKYINNNIATLQNNLIKLQNDLATAKNEVSKIDNDIQKNKNSIEYYKNIINDKTSAYNNCPWWDKWWRLLDLSAVSTANGVVIAALYVDIGIKESAKLAALGLLEVAEFAVKEAEKLLNTAKTAVDQGLLDAKALAGEMLKQAENFLTGLQNTLGIFRQFSIDVVNAAGNLLAIREARFIAGLDSVNCGTILLDVDLTFLGKAKTIQISYNFLNKEVGINDFVEVLKSVGKSTYNSPLEIAKESRSKGTVANIAAGNINSRFPKMTPIQIAAVLNRAEYNFDTEIAGYLLNQALEVKLQTIKKLMI